MGQNKALSYGQTLFTLISILSMAGCFSRGGVSTIVVQKVATRQADGKVKLVWPRPAQVNSLKARPGIKKVTLHWAHDPKADTYTVIRAETPTGPWLVRALVRNPVTTYTDRAVKKDVAYYYSVRAANRGSKSSFGRLAKVSPPVAPPKAGSFTPIKVLAHARTLKSIRVAWKHAPQPHTGYQVERCQGKPKVCKIVATLSADAVFFDDPDVRRAAAYTYRVKFRDRVPQAYSAEAEAKVIAGRLPPLGAMALLPGGCFTMGDESETSNLDERPAHKVCLRQFLMDVYEVTNRQYAMCVGAGRCLPPRSEEDAPPGGHYRQAARARHPVVNVSWMQARAYCAYVNKRLPTEAEWEFAARGGVQGGSFYWGGEPDCLYANISLSGTKCQLDSTPVGRYPPNDYGIYDIIGNAWEWVFDWYSSGFYAKSPRVSPIGPRSGSRRVRRGGSWSSIYADDAFENRAILAREASSRTGFRCAR